MKNGKDKYQVLTKGEMDIMNKLWSLDKEASTKDLLENFDEPKPAYTTVATFLKILSAKGFVTETKYKETGKTLFYKPLISQKEYTTRVMDDVTTNFFGGSVKSLVNFFVREEKISSEELEQLLNLVNSKE